MAGSMLGVRRWLVAAMCATVAGSSLHAQSPADTLISVGTYRLHLRVYRGGEPTILLESGAGLVASQWDAVAPGLVRETGATVVSYDRAGYGASDLPNEPYDVRREMAGIWDALEQLGLSDSLVLVGHSYGGLLIQVLAHEHPDAVMGMVYVDPLLVGYIDALGGFDSLRAQINLLPPDTTPPSPGDGRQGAAIATTIATVRASSVPASIPVRMITSGQQWWATEKANRAFRAAHEALAHSALDGQLVVAEKSQHMITDTEPEMIVQVIRDLLRSLARR